ncbi:FAD-dependent oxidoreductase [Gracilimonas sediminicola]|uniref:D-amino-acid oxidase n=1 Tax=Gracilimonas sediminicola TaxID=2952158 RepID=A0A9X2REL3_9BACT|nr:FAD-dependent oxidoreductase [Gracilimonas sediminicola]MCP9292045.1 FAD-binding oxidoreductase [Gracilimonas sediminicola]
MSKKRNVCIIGCGVSGLSVAKLLQQHNWKVTILSESDPRIARNDPTFSSLFPAASVIPRSVNSGEIDSIFKESLSHFDVLYERQFPGLKVHEHFELFAFGKDCPGYAQHMDGFSSLEEFRDSFHPTHSGITIQAGWKFNCYFCDWSLYYPALLNSVLKAGAELQIQSLGKEDLKDLPFDIVINCSGLGSVELFDDPNGLLYRGHLLQILDAPILKNPNGDIVSYNFSPGTEIYHTESGNAQDVYFYPRSDGWILGGSRQEGRLDEHGKWIGEQTITPNKRIDGTVIPEQMYTLHKDILQESFGMEIDRFTKRKVKIGYRYLRKNEDGLRLEAEQMHNRLFIHNYGHGGAGVTLSWGCAEKVLKLLLEHVS